MTPGELDGPLTDGSHAWESEWRSGSGKPVGLRPQSASSRAQLRDATDEVMADIADLCGQPYDDHYARLATT